MLPSPYRIPEPPIEPRSQSDIDENRVPWIVLIWIVLLWRLATAILHDKHAAFEAGGVIFLLSLVVWLVRARKNRRA